MLDAPPTTIHALRKTSEYWKTSLTLWNLLLVHWW